MCRSKSAAQKYCEVSDEENSEVLKDRIRFILDIANDNEVDTLILGAHGSGVFGQNSEEVAEAFMNYLTTTYAGCFKKVVFAVPKGNGNFEKFEKKVRKE